MQIREVQAKSILTKSGIADYCINAYMGCSFGCTYCYAQLIIRKFHPGEKWGGYLDIKVNAPELLEKEIKKAKRGVVMLSTVTDPYQPMEKKYELTKKCLQILLEHDFPITILTRSPLVTRDIGLLKKFRECTVGVSITTNDNRMKNIFEPLTPDFSVRVETLKKLHEAGLETYAFVGPMLPMDPQIVGESIAPYLNSVIIDRPNYPQLWKKIADENGIEITVHESSKYRDVILGILKENDVSARSLF